MPRPTTALSPVAPRTGAVFVLLGKRWTGQIIDLLLQGPARFGLLAASLPGLSHRVLTERLTELQRAGLVAHASGPEGPIYALTPHGEGLRPAMEALAAWAETSASDGDAGDAPPAAAPCLDGQRGAWEAFSYAGERVRDALEQRVQHRAGMPPSYFELLVQLRLAPGQRLRMSELAAATRSKPSRITYAVTRLEQAGWVIRDSDPTDGRGSTATLTEQGLQAMNEARPEYTRTIHDHVLDPLAPHERNQLRMLCEKILASFDHTDGHDEARV
ncbi:winged helix-turn-helix transcriptional regulator [Actinoallomurus vinaceus]|uniref:winged helix-turn-helix transcriptional regulator n=1 Tax=Actinoallomurus vinaceus TaxID=1080074 RepID=UPI0031E57D01